MPRRLCRLLLATALAVAFVACGGGDETVSTEELSTPAGLRDAGERSAEESFRYEAFFETAGTPMDVDANEPIVTGSVDGPQSSARVDMSSLFAAIPAEQLPAELRDAGFVMEVVVDGDTQYVRAPFLSAIARLAGPASPLGSLTDLGDGWGEVDATALGGSGLATAIGGSGGGDPMKLFALLDEVADVESVGTEEIRGTEATGLRAQVTFGEILRSQGLDEEQMGEGLGELADLTLPIEVWADDRGFVRRLVVSFDAEALIAAAKAAGKDAPAADEMGDFSFTMRMEMFDYGDDVDIEVPEEATDVTDAFEALLELTGG